MSKSAKNKEEKLFNDMLTKNYTKDNEKLIIPIGICDDNEQVYINLETINGLFIGGTTGSGKSVLIDNIIKYLKKKNSSDNIKFLLLDPKKIELFEYNGMDYLYNKEKIAIKMPRIALDKLLDILKEMSRRADLIIESNSKDITSYNEKVKEKLPHIFVIIDESTDIMKYKDSQTIIERILDSGKPLGIHVILATNAYLKDYYDSKFIKHFKYRISFDMASKEQAKYIEIKKSDLLKGCGTGIIKYNDKVVYQFHTESPNDF